MVALLQASDTRLGARLRACQCPPASPRRKLDAPDYRRRTMRSLAYPTNRRPSMPRTKMLSIVTLAFIAGATASRVVPFAAAQTPPAAPLTAQIIDVDALDGAAIGPIQPNTELRSK